MNLLARIIDRFDPALANFHPSDIYQKTWLLKTLLDQMDRLGVEGAPLSFTPGASWFTDALLPTPFAARYPSDPHADNSVQVDAVIGHVTIDGWQQALLALAPEADQFTVIISTLGERLDAGPQNARYFSQASRTVAAITEALHQAERAPEMLADLELVLIAPGSAIEREVYQEDMARDSIREDIQRKAAAYQGQFDQWIEEWFAPTMSQMELQTISWSQAFDQIAQSDLEAAETLREFYNLCQSWHE